MAFFNRFMSWLRGLRNHRYVAKIITISRLLVLPGFEKVPLYDVMVFFVESLVKGKLFQRTAALTYHVFIALIPFLLAIFSFISLLGESIKKSLLVFIESMVPTYVWPAISNVIHEVVMRPSGTLFSFSFLLGMLLFYFGINAIVNILNSTYFNLQKRPFFKRILTNLFLLFTTITIVLLIVFIFSFNSYIIKHLHLELIHLPALTAVLIWLLKWFLIAIFIYTLVSLFYYVAPINKKYFRFFSAGSTFCTILIILLLWTLNIYFSNFSNYNLIYGSIGALFAILLSIYWICFIFLVGFDLNVSIYIAKENVLENRPFKLQTSSFIDF